MPAIVLVALDAPDAGVVVLSPPRDGQRVVVESCALAVADLSRYLRQLADLYGAREAGRWACASTEESAAVARLSGAATDGCIYGRAGQLDLIPRPARLAPIPESDHPLAYRRALAMARAFKLRSLRGDYQPAREAA